MSQWEEEVTAKLRIAETEKLVFHVLENAAVDLGFENCGYRMSLNFPISRPTVVSIDNFPLGWQERYLSAGYLEVDPSVAHCRRSDKPVVWCDQLFATSPQLWCEAKSYGLAVGWSQSTHSIHGARGMLTFVRRSVPLTPTELLSKEQRMSFLAGASHEAMLRTLAPRSGWRIPALTEREVEALKWTADGKTTADIADILGLSQNTVKFHIKNATAKLNVTNKTAAVVKAAMHGWLHS